MLKGNNLTGFANAFSTNNFKKNDEIVLNFKMVECNSIDSIEHNFIDTSNLSNQQFRLDKISEIEDYFITEIKERKLMSK